MAELLSHPLIVLLAGAVLTGLLIPWLTRQWQDRQKELELKTELVTELSESIMNIIMSVQFAHLGAKKQDEFDKACKEWEVQSAVIHTKLQAYFPHTTIPDEWCKFSQILTDFHALEGVGETRVMEIKKAISDLLGPGVKVGESWGELKDAIVKKKSQLIQKVLESKVEAFGF